MNLKSGRIEGFEGYSQFKSVKEFNTHIEMWLAVKKHEFSKGELVGLKRLVRFSAKIPGVCNAKIGTLLKVFNEVFNGDGSPGLLKYTMTTRTVPTVFFYKKNTKISQISLVFDKIHQYDGYCRNIYPI